MNPTNLILGGATGIGGALQGHFNRKLSRENTDKTILANKEMAEYAYRKDQEQWNRANAYNTPSSQMQRYKEAGLNPNMIYGSGTASAGNTATALPKYQAPRQEYNYKTGYDIPGTLSQFANFAQQKVNIDLVREQTNTQVLENELRSGRIQSQLTEAQNRARESGSMADLKHLQSMEAGWRAYSGLTMQKALAEVQKSQYQAKTAGSEASIAAWRKKLADQGMSINDPLWMRQILDKGESVLDFIKKGRNSQHFIPYVPY